MTHGQISRKASFVRLFHMLRLHIEKLTDIPRLDTSIQLIKIHIIIPSKELEQEFQKTEIIQPSRLTWTNQVGSYTKTVITYYISQAWKYAAFRTPYKEEHWLVVLSSYKSYKQQITIILASSCIIHKSLLDSVFQNTVDEKEENLQTQTGMQNREKDNKYMP